MNDIDMRSDVYLHGRGNGRIKPGEDSKGFEMSPLETMESRRKSDEKHILSAKSIEQERSQSSIESIERFTH